MNEKKQVNKFLFQITILCIEKAAVKFYGMVRKYAEFE